MHHTVSLSVRGDSNIYGDPNICGGPNDQDLHSDSASDLSDYSIISDVDCLSDFSDIVKFNSGSFGDIGPVRSVRSHPSMHHPASPDQDTHITLLSARGEPADHCDDLQSDSELSDYSIISDVDCLSDFSDIVNIGHSDDISLNSDGLAMDCNKTHGDDSTVPDVEINGGSGSSMGQTVKKGPYLSIIRTLLKEFDTDPSVGNYFPWRRSTNNLTADFQKLSQVLYLISHLQGGNLPTRIPTNQQLLTFLSQEALSIRDQNMMDEVLHTAHMISILFNECPNKLFKNRKQVSLVEFVLVHCFLLPVCIRGLPFSEQEGIALLFDKLDDSGICGASANGHLTMDIFSTAFGIFQDFILDKSSF